MSRPVKEILLVTRHACAICIATCAEFAPPSSLAPPGPSTAPRRAPSSRSPILPGARGARRGPLAAFQRRVGAVDLDWVRLDGLGRALAARLAGREHDRRSSYRTRARETKVGAGAADLVASVFFRELRLDAQRLPRHLRLAP